MIVSTIEDLPPIHKPVVTIGIFDGVHLGHRYILNELKENARAVGGESVVLTLWPHPRLVLDKYLGTFRLLHTKEEKIRALEACGIDHLVLIPFNEELASMSTCDFVRSFLVDRLSIEALVLGHDNRFGSEGQDDEGLQHCAAGQNFRLLRLPEFKPAGQHISSTVIRGLLLEGELEEANRLLGFSFSLRGEIVEGNRIGRQIGYPTANVHPEGYKLIPMNGVYAIEAELKGRTYGGMLNIGFRPTLDSPIDVKTIEAHLFGMSGDLYGEEVELRFLARMRKEMKFSSLDELSAQLARDERLARQILKLE